MKMNYLVNLFVKLILFTLTIKTVISRTQNDDEQHMVAFVCGMPAKHLTSQGWIGDDATDCLKDAGDILNYCKKSYPKLVVRNVLETDDDVVIENWCNFSGRRCHQSFTVRPIRCLTDPFKGNALLVPESCMFDHILSSNECKTHKDWNVTASQLCASRRMQLRTFSVRQPCDVAMFGSIQFVCCPSARADVKALGESNSPNHVSKKKEAYKSYAAHPNDRHSNEHENFAAVKAALKKQTNEEMSKVMLAWNEAQREVEKIRSKDKQTADKLEKKISARFEKTISSLEEKEETEKRRAEAIHEERVRAELDRKKAEAMQDYMALVSNDSVTSKDLLRALKRYLKMEERYRLHLVDRYQRLVKTDPSAAESEREPVVERLRTVRQRVDEAVGMLGRAPAYGEEIKKKIGHLLNSYHPSVDDNEALIPSSDEKMAEDEQVEMDEDDDNEVETNGRKTKMKKNEGVAATKREEEEDDEEEQDDEEDEGDEEETNSEMDEKEDREMKGEKEKDDEEDEDELLDIVEEDDEDGGRKKQSTTIATLEEDDDEEEEEDDESDDDDDDDDEEEKNVDDTEFVIKPLVDANHLGRSELNLEESKTFIKKRHDGRSTAAGPLAVAVATVGIVIIVATVLSTIVWRRKAVTRNGAAAGKLLDGQDQPAISAEEKHVAGMQMNGYENPTYRYFENGVSDAAA